MVRVKDLPAGWLSKADQAELRRLARGRFVLELGAWKGRSTTVMSKVASYVVSVDRHRGIADDFDHGDSLPTYIAEIRPLRNVAMVVADFVDFVPLLRERFDLVFIDGDHDYDSVLRDIALALLVNPSVIAMHDYDYSEVRRAAREVFGEPTTLGGSVASFKR